MKKNKTQTLKKPTCLADGLYPYMGNPKMGNLGPAVSWEENINVITVQFNHMLLRGKHQSKIDEEFILQLRHYEEQISTFPTFPDTQEKIKYFTAIAELAKTTGSYFAAYKYAGLAYDAIHRLKNLHQKNNQPGFYKSKVLLSKITQLFLVSLEKKKYLKSHEEESFNQILSDEKKRHGLLEKAEAHIVYAILHPSTSKLALKKARNFCNEIESTDPMVLCRKYTGMAVYYEMLGDNKRAESYYQLLLENNPTLWTSQYERYIKFISKHEYLNRKKEGILRSAIKNTLGFIEQIPAYIKLINLLTKQNKIQEKEDVYSRLKDFYSTLNILHKNQKQPRHSFSKKIKESIYINNLTSHIIDALCKIGDFKYATTTAENFIFGTKNTREKIPGIYFRTEGFHKLYTAAEIFIRNNKYSIAHSLLIEAKKKSDDQSLFDLNREFLSYIQQCHPQRKNRKIKNQRSKILPPHKIRSPKETEIPDSKMKPVFKALRAGKYIQAAATCQRIEETSHKSTEESVHKLHLIYFYCGIIENKDTMRQDALSKLKGFGAPGKLTQDVINLYKKYPPTKNTHLFTEWLQKTIDGIKELKTIKNLICNYRDQKQIRDILLQRILNFENLILSDAGVKDIFIGELIAEHLIQEQNYKKIYKFLIKPGTRKILKKAKNKNLKLKTYLEAATENEKKIKKWVYDRFATEGILDFIKYIDDKKGTKMHQIYLKTKRDHETLFEEPSNPTKKTRKKKRGRSRKNRGKTNKKWGKQKKIFNPQQDLKHPPKTPSSGAEPDLNLQPEPTPEQFKELQSFIKRQQAAKEKILQGRQQKKLSQQQRSKINKKKSNNPKNFSPKFQQNRAANSPKEKTKPIEKIQTKARKNQGTKKQKPPKKDTQRENNNLPTIQPLSVAELEQQFFNQCGTPPHQPPIITSTNPMEVKKIEEEVEGEDYEKAVDNTEEKIKKFIYQIAKKHNLILFGGRSFRLIKEGNIGNYKKGDYDFVLKGNINNLKALAEKLKKSEKFTKTSLFEHYGVLKTTINIGGIQLEFDISSAIRPKYSKARSQNAYSFTTLSEEKQLALFSIDCDFKHKVVFIKPEALNPFLTASNFKNRSTKLIIDPQNGMDAIKRRKVEPINRDILGNTLLKAIFGHEKAPEKPFYNDDPMRIWRYLRECVTAFEDPNTSDISNITDATLFITVTNNIHLLFDARYSYRTAAYFYKLFCTGNGVTIFNLMLKLGCLAKILPTSTIFSESSLKGEISVIGPLFKYNEKDLHNIKQCLHYIDCDITKYHQGNNPSLTPQEHKALFLLALFCPKIKSFRDYKLYLGQLLTRINTCLSPHNNTTQDGTTKMLDDVFRGKLSNHLYETFRQLTGITYKYRIDQLQQDGPGFVNFINTIEHAQHIIEKHIETEQQLRMKIQELISSNNLNNTQEQNNNLPPRWSQQQNAEQLQPTVFQNQMPQQINYYNNPNRYPQPNFPSKYGSQQNNRHQQAYNHTQLPIQTQRNQNMPQFPQDGYWQHRRQPPQFNQNQQYRQTYPRYQNVQHRASPQNNYAHQQFFQQNNRHQQPHNHTQLPIQTQRNQNMPQFPQDGYRQNRRQPPQFNPNQRPPHNQQLPPN